MPRRIVSLVPSLTETVFDFGCGSLLDGRTPYCCFPKARVEAVPMVGGPKDPDLGRILALKPDLVLASQEENRKPDVDTLRAAGVEVWAAAPTSVAETIRMLWDLSRVLEVPHRSQTVDVLERQYEWALRAAEGAERRRVFCPIWREPDAPAPVEWWMTISQQTYVHDLLGVFGLDNVFAERERRYPLAADLDPARPARSTGGDTRYPRVSPAEVAAQAPDMIVLPGEPYRFGERDLDAFSAWPSIPAVRDGRLVLVDGSLLTWPGTRLSRALRELPAALQVG
jgi:ABC-type Fe3+-hydroxamate transport system substrate-binding protein